MPADSALRNVRVQIDADPLFTLTASRPAPPPDQTLSVVVEAVDAAPEDLRNRAEGIILATNEEITLVEEPASDAQLRFRLNLTENLQEVAGWLPLVAKLAVVLVGEPATDRE